MKYIYPVDDKSLDNYTNGAIKCPNCGHSVHFVKVDKTICKWCGRYVFKNRKAEFEYRIKSKRNTLKSKN